MPWRTHVDLDLQRWDCREVSHAHQVVGCAGEAEDPVHFAHSAMPHFAQQGDRLQPAETRKSRSTCVRQGMELDRKSLQTPEINLLNITNDEHQKENRAPINFSAAC